MPPGTSLALMRLTFLPQRNMSHRGDRRFALRGVAPCARQLAEKRDAAILVLATVMPAKKNLTHQQAHVAQLAARRAAACNSCLRGDHQTVSVVAASPFIR
jgi:hypothetical protein